jgi:drug/metabolite transporter (DMT)-like permease
MTVRRATTPDTGSKDKPGRDKPAAFGATDLLLFLMTLIWGTNFSVIKYTFRDIAPLSFNGLRMTLASLVLAGVTLITVRSLRVAREDLGRLFILGFLSNTCYQGMFIVGAGRTRAGNAALIVSTTPLFTALVSWLRKEERFTSKGIAGLILAVGGIGLIVWGGRAESAQGASLIGDGLVLGATVCWSFYTIWSRPLLHSYGSTKTTALTMMLGTPLLVVICLPSLLSQDWAAVRMSSWGGVMYSALLSIAAAYIIWNYGVRKLGSTRTAIFSNLTPVIGLVVAWAALGETPAAGQLAGAATIFVSIYLVRRGAIPLPGTDAEEELEEVSLAPR